MISVVIPLYNKKESIAHTLECVLKQTYQDFEVVVVDDGSTDGSAEIVEGVADGRIRLIRQENGGVSAARNRGIKEAKREYVAFLDADDEWKPEHLETLVRLIEKYPQCGAYSTNYEFNHDCVIEQTILNKIPFDGEDGVLSNYFEVASCSHPPVCSITVCIKKSVLDEIGGFPIGIKSGEDLVTWARIAVRTNWAYSRKPTATYIENILFDGQYKNLARIGGETYILDEIEKLVNSSIGKQKQEIKHYQSRLYRIFAAIRVEVGMGNSGICYAWDSLKCRFSIPVLAIFVLCLLPNKVSEVIFNKVR